MNRPTCTVRRGVATFLLLLLVSGCRAPHRDYSLEQIRAVDNLAELMDVQATVADPCFEYIDKLGDREVASAWWDRFQDLGTRLQATSARVVEFSEGPDFDQWNAELGAAARQLVQQATARDRTGAVRSIRAIRESCRACHDKYN